MLRLSSTTAFNGHKALIQEVSEICKLIIIAPSALDDCPTGLCCVSMQQHGPYCHIQNTLLRCDALV